MVLKELTPWQALELSQSLVLEAGVPAPQGGYGHLVGKEDEPERSSRERRHLRLPGILNFLISVPSPAPMCISFHKLQTGKACRLDPGAQTSGRPGQRTRDSSGRSLKGCIQLFSEQVFKSLP